MAYKHHEHTHGKDSSSHDDHYHYPEHGGHGHSHGRVDPTILRSKKGVRAVSWSFIVLFVTAAIQIYVYSKGNSVALLTDVIHNFGDALTAIPLGIAFFLRSRKLENWSGYFVVLLIFISALVALYAVIDRFINPLTPTNLWAIFAAGLIGVIGNELAAVIRWRAGKKLNSPALVADGNHARTDGLVSLGVIISTIFIALGFPIADPIIGLVIMLMIIRITWQSWQVIRGSH